MTNSYRARHIRRRLRSTKVDVEARRDALLEIIQDGHLMTVLRGLVEKAETAYSKIQNLTITRRAEDLPYRYLADNTCWQRKPRFNSVDEALKRTAQFYRKLLWADNPLAFANVETSAVDFFAYVKFDALLDPS
jgi:hypothetical protein